MLASELPSLSQLLGLGNRKKNKVYWKDDEMVWTSQSAASLSLIFEAYRECASVEKVRVWVPDFFCSETIDLIKKTGVEIVFYPINQNLDPDWKTIKLMDKTNIPNFFLFVHYFGVWHETNDARIFCNNNNCILIEDCAHVLLKRDKFGRKADISIFSPHKILPVYDGAMIYFNKTMDIIYEMENLVKKRLDDTNTLTCYRWRLKKAVQKIVRKNKPLTITEGPHFAKKTRISQIHNNYKITKWSKKTLQNYSYEDLKKIELIRKKNLKVLNYIIKNNFDGVEPVVSDDTLGPYVAVYSLKNVDDRMTIISKIKSHGYSVLYWPSLASEVKNLEFTSIASELSENLIVIPVHQGLKPHMLLKNYVKKSNTCNGISIEKVSSNVNAIDALNINYEKENIPQNSLYASVKSFVEGYTHELFYVKNGDNQYIGYVNVLVKRFLGLPLFVRVNRGPLLLKQHNKFETIFKTIDLIKGEKKFLPMVVSPNIEFTPASLHVALNYGWKCFNYYGYSSGLIDLTLDEDCILSSFNSKWRNQLRSAIKKKLVVNNCYDRIDEMLALYKQDQIEKGYKGLPDKILQELFSQKSEPLLPFYVVNCENKIIAFTLIYRGDNCAHYLVGFNDYEGRKIYANNYLLYNAMLDCKKRGFNSFDLGGIDFIHTEDIAKFKQGLNPNYYSLIGDFWKIM